MTRPPCAIAIGAALLLAGCAERLVELRTDRPPAVVVDLIEGPIRCPADTAGYLDDDPRSGAGSVPAGFEARTVLRCRVDFTRGTARGRVDRLPAQQWEAPVTPQLRTALDLPDRELRPAVACAASIGAGTAVYLVDARLRAVRVRLPADDPCDQVRPEVADLLPSPDASAEDTFTVSRLR